MEVRKAPAHTLRGRRMEICSSEEEAASSSACPGSKLQAGGSSRLHFVRLEALLQTLTGIHPAGAIGGRWGGRGGGLYPFIDCFPFCSSA